MSRQIKFAAFLAIALASISLSALPTSASPATCNPTQSSVGNDTVLTFSTTGICDWTVPAQATTAEFLLIGGGGGGGGGAFGGGGGAGGFVSKSNVSLTAGDVVTVTIGAGGAGGANNLGGNAPGANGSDSSISNNVVRAGFTRFVSTGGGGGAGFLPGGGSRTNANGLAGGSGGGSSEGSTSFGASTQNTYSGAGFGNVGGSSSSSTSKSGGGGGGAGGAGTNAETAGQYIGGAGGAGKSSSISGATVTYASGGDGGSNAGQNVRTAEPANSGNGGDGADWPGTPMFGGAGGSGLFVVRFASAPPSFNASFDSQGGTAFTDTVTRNGETINDPGSPTKNGFTFNGWYLAQTGGTALIFPYAHGQTTAFTLFAQWSAVQSSGSGNSYSPPAPLPSPTPTPTESLEPTDVIFKADVFFSPNSSALRGMDKTNLNQLAKKLIQVSETLNSKPTIRISGFVVGNISIPFNKSLALARAKTAMNSMKRVGITGNYILIPKSGSVAQGAKAMKAKVVISYQVD